MVAAVRDDDFEVGRPERALVRLRQTQLDLLGQIESLNSISQRSQRQPGVEQGGQEHVAADPGEAVREGDLHGSTSLRLPWR